MTRWCWHSLIFRSNRHGYLFRMNLIKISSYHTTFHAFKHSDNDCKVLEFSKWKTYIIGFISTYRCNFKLHRLFVYIESKCRTLKILRICKQKTAKNTRILYFIQVHPKNFESSDALIFASTDALFCHFTKNDFNP